MNAAGVRLRIASVHYAGKKKRETGPAVQIDEEFLLRIGLPILEHFRICEKPAKSERVSHRPACLTGSAHYGASFTWSRVPAMV